MDAHTVGSASRVARDIDPTAEQGEAIARLLADEPGWIERTLAGCVPNHHGDCAGCGSYRPVRWPCVQVWLARRAQQILRERALGAAGGARAASRTGQTT